MTEARVGFFRSLLPNQCWAWVDVVHYHLGLAESQSWMSAVTRPGEPDLSADSALHSAFSVLFLWTANWIRRPVGHPQLHYQIHNGGFLGEECRISMRHRVAHYIFLGLCCNVFLHIWICTSNMADSTQRKHLPLPASVVNKQATCQGWLYRTWVTFCVRYIGTVASEKNACDKLRATQTLRLNSSATYP